MPKTNENLATVSNQSTTKALSIIELLAENRIPMRLMDIAAALDMNNSTASRFLMALQNRGYVEKDGASLYKLTYKICYLANMIGNTQLSEQSHPYLVKISHTLGESSCISVEREMRMVYVDVETGPNKMLMSMQSIGNSSPMHSTGNGKLAMLEYSDAMISQYVKNGGLTRFTPNTIATEESLKKELAIVRAAGYAMDNEESELGVRCIACPIKNYTGKIIAGMSVTGPTSRITDSFIDNNLPFLKEMALDLSKKLGYQGEF